MLGLRSNFFASRPPTSGAILAAVALAAVGVGCDEGDRLVAASEFFEPEVLDFQVAATGEVTTLGGLLRNSTGSPLRVQAVRFVPEQGVYGAFLATGGTLVGASLAPGGVADVELRFGPPSAGSYDAVMQIEAEDVLIEVPILAQAEQLDPASPEAVPASLAFSGVPVGSVGVRLVRITNVGARAGGLSRVLPSGTGFEVGAVGGGPLGTLGQPLEPGDSLDLEVRFRPTELGAVTGQLLVIFDNDSSTLVPLRGEASEAPELACPRLRVSLGAVPRGSTSQETISCQRLGSDWSLGAARLRSGGDSSFSLIGAPRLSGDQLEIDVGFSADGTIGTHGTELEIESTGGLQTFITLTATTTPPNEADLFLSLTWNTPYSDFDLHLVREGGTPFLESDDCYFASKSPDWGSPDDRLDNPYLDTDDREGYGPEEISLFTAREASYDVFVQFHDFSRDRAEPSTLRVDYRLRGGTAGSEMKDVLECAQWWHVGRIRTGPMRFERVDTLTTDWSARAQCGAG